jgi:hypothetical protein
MKHCWENKNRTPILEIQHPKIGVLERENKGRKSLMKKNQTFQS